DSKRNPRGTAHPAPAAFLSGHHQAIQAEQTLGIRKLNNTFSYRRNWNSSRTASTAALRAKRSCTQDKRKNILHSAVASPGVANLYRLEFPGNSTRRSYTSGNNRRHRSSPNRG